MRSYFIYFQGIKVANSHSLFKAFITMKISKRTSRIVKVISLQALITKIKKNDSSRNCR